MNIGHFIENEASSAKKLSLIDLVIQIIQNSNHGIDFFDFTDNERLVWNMRRREFVTVLSQT